MTSSASSPNHIVVRDLTLAYGETVIQRDVRFEVPRGRIFVIMGGSGCGKSTLLHAMIGLLEPAGGEVLYDGTSFWGADPDERESMTRHFGISYQSGALWSSMTLAENVSLPLEEYTDLDGDEIARITSLKLALMGLAGFEEYYPAEISGGMRKRAALARATALDPEILFFDEPSAGLDPISSERLDELILELRDSMGMTIVVVTHELASIFTIADDSILLDAQSKTMIARGKPSDLLEGSSDPRVVEFLSRGRKGGGAELGPRGDEQLKGDGSEAMI
ncbi:MAG: ATP-binding cassette domain-containing protein [Gemmatimonadota bacterium]